MPTNESVVAASALCKQIICLDRLIVGVCVFNEARRGMSDV